MAKSTSRPRGGAGGGLWREGLPLLFWVRRCIQVENRNEERAMLLEHLPAGPGDGRKRKALGPPEITKLWVVLTIDIHRLLVTIGWITLGLLNAHDENC